MFVLVAKKNRFFTRLILALAVVLALVCCSNHPSEVATHADLAQRTFATPQAAGDALFAAAKAGDQNTLMAIFGPEGNDFVYSGDPIKDKNAMQYFVSEYSQMNRWSLRKSGDQILYIGADNFAFPIPLSQKSHGQWVFNTDAGKDEVLARRIGDGELTAIGVLTEIASAQHKYFSQKHEFAQKFVSGDNQQDGLYWPVSQGAEPSPLSNLAEDAKALGYSKSDKPQPFNGYYYKLLTQQGDAAKGGSKDYEVDGKLTGGFAVLAWPAKYQDSGIMTFMVGNDGIVYQKDLGRDTAHAASAIDAYNPGGGWKAVLTPDSSYAVNASRNPKHE
jgi:hypothetical protein